MEYLQFDPSILEKRAVKLELDPRYKVEKQDPVRKPPSLFPERDNSLAKLKKKVKYKEPVMKRPATLAPGGAPAKKPASKPSSSSLKSSAGAQSSQAPKTVKPSIDFNSAIWTTPFGKKKDQSESESSSSDESSYDSSSSSSESEDERSTKKKTVTSAMQKAIQNRKVQPKTTPPAGAAYKPSATVTRIVEKKGTSSNVYSTAGVSPKSLKVDQLPTSKPVHMSNLPKSKESANGTKDKPSWYLLQSPGTANGSKSGPTKPGTSTSSSSLSSKQQNKYSDDSDDDLFGDRLRPSTGTTSTTTSKTPIKPIVNSTTKKPAAVGQKRNRYSDDEDERDRYKKKVTPTKYRYSDDEDEDDYEDDGFVVGTKRRSKDPDEHEMLQSVLKGFRRGANRYQDYDDYDDRSMEASYGDLLQEEFRSSRTARLEDKMEEEKEMKARLEKDKRKKEFQKKSSK